MVRAVGVGMLFILTGDIQTGKTTWLQARVNELEAAGVPVHGVLAPGMWCNGEKTGIENVLLPSHERILLATPIRHGRSAGIGWEFDAAALARVNAHLAGLSSVPENAPGLLVIDEIGPLELRQGSGLTEGLALLDAGPTPAWPNALVVVRSSLAEEAAARLRHSWGSVELVRPDEDGVRRLSDAIHGALQTHLQK